MSVTQRQDLLHRLSRSGVFLDYEQAFTDATRLPLIWRPPETWNLAQRGERFENPFCVMKICTGRTCAHCLAQQQQIAASGGNVSAQTKTVTCLSGLCVSAVPVQVGTKLVGYLQTGGVALEAPSLPKFDRIVRQLAAWGARIDLTGFQEAYFQSRVLTPGQYQSMLKLVEMFAQHLVLLANQVTVQDRTAEPLPVRRAKAFMAAHQAEAVTLGQVARHSKMSTFYFCKTFKKATGLTFTGHLGRLRIEKAKGLLLNPNLRVSEIAYEVGFQSLTHFNRLFSKHGGQSPTAYRAALVPLRAAPGH